MGKVTHGRKNGIIQRMVDSVKETAPVIIEKIVEVPVEVIKEIEVIKEVQVMVPVEVIKEVPIEVVKYITQEKIVEKRVPEIIIKEVPVEVVKEVHNIQHVLIEKEKNRQLDRQNAILKVCIVCLIIISIALGVSRG